MAKFISDKLHFCVLYIAVAVLTTAIAEKSTNVGSKHVKKDSFHEYSQLNDFYDVQSDGIPKKKISQYRSKTKKELQWNELSESSSSKQQHLNLDSYQEHIDDNDYYIEGETVPHLQEGDEFHSRSMDNSLYQENREPRGRGYDRRPPIHKETAQLTPVISTRYGQIQGAYEEVPGGSAGRVAVFLGIPYATPPVKSNRLSPTRAATQWKGVMKALSMPPACPQRPPKHLERLFQHQSEDCLYLNIYAPGE